MLPRLRALSLSVPVVIAILGTGFVSLASLAAVGYIPLPDSFRLRSQVHIPPVPELWDATIPSMLDDVQLTSVALIEERDARLARLAVQLSLQLLNQPVMPSGSGSHAAADRFLYDSLRRSEANSDSSSVASSDEEISGANQFAGANGQVGANGELGGADDASAPAHSYGGGRPFDSVRRNGQTDLANLGLFQESFGRGGLASDTAATIFPTVPPPTPETPAPVVPGGGPSNSTPPSGGPPKDNPPNDPTDPGGPVDVPEPATMSMLALGMGMLWLSRGRRGRGLSHY